MDKKPLVILTGPTAVGKTALSLKLARAIGAEIISADSMQVYRGMDIGSAKIPLSEREGIPHHLLDIKDPREPFDVTEFVRLAKAAAEEIRGRGHIPLVAGGTGFYIQALLKDIDFSEGEQNGALRRELEAFEEREGAEALHRLLEREDPEAAAQIHPNNVKRVIRALEYIRGSGRSITLANAEQSLKESPYNFAYFVLDRPREELYARIDARVDEMMAGGLLREVEGLRAQGLPRGLTSMQGLGYKELLDYFDGLLTLEEAVTRIKTETRHFAKRQLTWFRREKDVIWLEKEDFPTEELQLAYMLEVLSDKGILPAETEGGNT